MYKIAKIENSFISIIFIIYSEWDVFLQIHQFYNIYCVSVKDNVVTSRWNYICKFYDIILYYMLHNYLHVI